MRKLIVLFIVIIIASASLAIGSTTKGLPAPAVTPENAEMGGFPPFNGPLTHEMQAMLGLHPDFLKQGGFYLVRNRETGTYEHRWMNAGTLGLMDETGEMRYQQSCGNRTVAMPTPAPPVVVKPCAPCPVCPPVVPAPAGLSFWQWLGRAAAVLGLGLLALALLGAMIAMFAAIARHSHRPGRWGWCYRCGRHHWFIN